MLIKKNVHFGISDTMDMILPMYHNDKKINVSVSFGTKIGYSPYLVSKSHNPTQLSEILGFFNASTLDIAIKKVVKEYMKDTWEINLMTGDGQIIRITKE